MTVLIPILMAVGAIALSFGIVAGLVYLICLCFSALIFSWKLAFGVWFIMMLLRMVFNHLHKD